MAKKLFMWQHSEGEKMSINASGSNSGSKTLVQVTGNMYSSQNQTITTSNINYTNGGLSFEGVSFNHPKGAHKASDDATRGQRGNVRNQRDNGENDQEAQSKNAAVDMLLQLTFASSLNTNDCPSPLQIRE